MPPRARRRSRQAIPYFYGAPPTAAKASSVGPLLVLGHAGSKRSAPRRPDQLAAEGYCANVVSYLCVNLVAGSFGGLPLLVFRGENEVPEHPLAQLIARPNPMRGKARFLQEVASFHLICGISFVEAVRSARRPPRELYTLPPQRMSVVPSATGLPARYVYEVNGRERVFDLDPVTGYGDVLCMKDFHPLDDWWGFSPTEAAAKWIDLDNAGADLNASTLQNGINSGFLFSNKAIANQQQGDECRAKIQERFGGYRRWGAPMVLGGEWQVQRLNDSLKDQQWTEGMHESARRICAAWNVPHILVVPGESTYANREQARLELWEHTVLPFAGLMLGDLVPWWRWLFQDESLDVRIDVDSISALEPRRETKRKMTLEAFKTKLLTLNEARAEYGDYDALPGGDEIAQPVAPARPPARAGADGQPVQDEAEEDGKAWQAQPRQAAGMAGAGRWIANRTVLPAEDFTHWLRTGRVPAKEPALDLPPNGHAAKPGKAAGTATLVKARDDSEWIDGALDDDALAEECLPVLREIIEHFGERVLRRVGLEIAFDVSDPTVAAFLRDFAGDRIKDLVGTTTRKELGAALAEVVERGGRFDEMLDAIRRVFTRASEERAYTIAVTETTRAATHGTLRGVAQSGVERVRWVSTADRFTRDTHRTMNGQTVNAGEDFVSPSGARGPGPGMLGDDPAENVRCRCFVVPVPDEKADELDAEWKALDEEAQPLMADLVEALRRGFSAQERRIVVEAARRFGQ